MYSILHRKRLNICFSASTIEYGVNFSMPVLFSLLIFLVFSKLLLKEGSNFALPSCHFANLFITANLASPYAIFLLLLRALRL